MAAANVPQSWWLANSTATSTNDSADSAANEVSAQTQTNVSSWNRSGDSAGVTSLRNVQGKAFLTRTTEAVRVVYYDVAVQILKQRKQVTPCYGGISNIHMNYNGEIWPCCVLGGDQ